VSKLLTTCATPSEVAAISSGGRLLKTGLGIVSQAPRYYRIAKSIDRMRHQSTRNAIEIGLWFPNQLVGHYNYHSCKVGILFATRIETARRPLTQFSVSAA
jgi:hypothetical protein